MTAPPPPSVTIERLERPSTDERAAIFAIETASFTNPWTPASFDIMMEAPASQLWVARAGGRIVAFCACYVFDDQLDINTVAVEAQHRRHGIARALLKRILTETGVRCATLDVRASNAAAIRLYEGFGFTVTGSRPGYYENPKEDCLILWLNP